MIAISNPAGTRRLVVERLDGDFLEGTILHSKYASSAISSRPPSGRSRMAPAQAAAHPAHARRRSLSSARRAKYKASVVQKISSVSVNAAAEYSAKNGHSAAKAKAIFAGFVPSRRRAIAAHKKHVPRS